MTHNEHEHHGHRHGHQGPGQVEHHGRKSNGLHKDWRTWVIVGLMLAAMAAYVLTMDESIQPGGVPGESMPADAPGL